MSDDKSKPGEPDRSQFPLSLDDARDHVAKHAPSREVVEAAAARMTINTPKTA